MKQKEKDKKPRTLLERLEDFIEFAEKTGKLQDVGFYREIKNELSSLQEDREMLRCLRAAGVDNWEGYEHAIDIMNGEDW